MKKKNRNPADYSFGDHFAISPKDIEYMAFNGQYRRVYDFFRILPKNKQTNYLNKFVFLAIVYGGIEKLREILRAVDTEIFEEERIFIEGVLSQFVFDCKESRRCPRELFQGLLAWNDILLRISLPNEAINYSNVALNLGINQYPDLYSLLLFRKAEELLVYGRLDEAHSIVSNMGEKYYLIPDSNLLAKTTFTLGKIALLTGQIDSYQKKLLKGLRFFYTDIHTRRLFVQQLIKTYRHFLNILMDGGISFSEKLLFFVHYLDYMAHNKKFIERIGLSRLSSMGVMGYVYIINYLGWGEKSTRPFGDSARADWSLRENGRKPAKRTSPKQENILITRAMGGVGDLLMMTPGMHALKEKFPEEELHLAIPKRFFCLFKGNNDVKMIDIEDVSLWPGSYRRWFNFTDCPAARWESLTAPRVKTSRIDIFSHAMGIRGSQYRRMQKKPKYFITQEEEAFREAFWKEHELLDKTVIGIQLRAAETYRDYPHMADLIEMLSKDLIVLAFHDEPIALNSAKNVIKIDSFSLREAFALAAKCDALIAPDSALVHIAGAFDILCIALYGPIDGKIRTKHYPSVKFLDARANLKCAPCWRNEYIPCKLTDMRSSVCMESIPVSEIYIELQKMIESKNRHARIDYT